MSDPMLKLSVEDKKIVAALWENEECPYFDLLLFEDGLILPLDVVANEDGITINPLGCLSASTALGLNHELNEGFAQLCHREYIELGLTGSSGDCCASGENGFVSVTSTSSGKLVWLAFFMTSNPFEDVCIDGDAVVARSTYGHSYKFKLSRPQEVVVTM